MRMHYGGEQFQVSSVEQLQDLEEAAKSTRPTWRSVRLEGGAYCRFLFGPGIAVAFSGLAENELPDEQVDIAFTIH
jgi:hypothetical protein